MNVRTDHGSNFPMKYKSKSTSLTERGLIAVKRFLWLADYPVL